MYQLLPQLAEQFNQVFPELQQQLDFVSKVVKEEEESFLRTLDKGLKKMDDIIAAICSNQVSSKGPLRLNYMILLDFRLTLPG